MQFKKKYKRECAGDPVRLREMLLAIPRHVTNVHEFPENVHHQVILQFSKHAGVSDPDSDLQGFAFELSPGSVYKTRLPNPDPAPWYQIHKFTRFSHVLETIKECSLPLLYENMIKCRLYSNHGNIVLQQRGTDLDTDPYLLATLDMGPQLDFGRNSDPKR